MKKAMVIMLIFVLVFFGAIYAFKQFVFTQEKKISKKFENPVITISATSAKTEEWDSSLSVVGSISTVQGVDVTTELSGMIEKIDFNSGDDVKKGQILVELDIAPDVAKLHELQAQASLAKITYDRDKKQYSFGAVSKEQLDTDEANMESSAASVQEQQATIDKKIIRAPFNGRTGITPVNLGEYITSGQSIVTLQTLNPIYVDFYLPQQEIQDVIVGQPVDVTSDRAPGKKFTGKITSINPVADSDIRNIEVEATLPNPQEILLPGMFADVKLYVGATKKYITLPQLAITFNPYGSIVYILQKTNQQFNGQIVWKAEQQFVKTGETRGNQIAVLSGIKADDMIVTSGQLKLRNDSLVIINNKIKPSDNPNPQVPEVR